MRALQSGASPAEIRRLALAGAAVDSIGGGLTKGPAMMAKMVSKKGKSSPAGALGQNAVDYLAGEVLTGAVYGRAEGKARPKQGGNKN